MFRGFNRTTNRVQQELIELVGTKKAKAYLKKLQTNTKFVNNVEFIFSHLETETDLINDIVYKPSDLDILTFKLYNVLQFKNHPEWYTLRKYKGVIEYDPKQQGDPTFEAKTLKTILERYLKRDVPLEEVFEEVQIEHYSSDIIDYMI